MMNGTIGILGGMGPEATVRMFTLIVERTKAETDQEHIPVLIFNNPKIPDRTGAIIGGGPSPLPSLIASAQKLESAGADLIIMPCHTAHYYYDEIITHITIPFLHLQEETGRFLVKEYKSLKKFGLLGTIATIRTGLFQRIFQRMGLEIIAPDETGQQKIMTAIYGPEGMKKGFKREPRELLLTVIEDLKKQGVEAIVAGCSEISLVLNAEELQLRVADPLRIIAEAAIIKAGYTTKN